MSNRHRYHIIIDEQENVEVVREQLEQSSLVDIKTWENFPLMMNISLTSEQADWLKTQPHIQFVERVQSVFLHEDKSVQYEIHLSSPSARETVRFEILKHLDVVVNAYEIIPSSLFVKLTEPQYVELLTLFGTGGVFSAVTNITANSDPVKEYSRVLNLQSYNWGVERITHRTTNFFERINMTRNGKGTRVFVVDTGVQSNHNELKGRVSRTHRFDAFRSPSDPNYGEPSTEITYDDSGALIVDDHGTHVASLAAGLTLGVAPAAEVISVRAFSNFDESTTEHLLDGINWVIQTHKTLGGPSVVNLSLAIKDSNRSSQSIANMIVSQMVVNGLVVVVSAGNEATDAFFSSPANATAIRSLVNNNGAYELRTTVSQALKPIVVGASVFHVNSATGTDTVWRGSNWGDIVDLFAPGADIYGASLSAFDGKVDLNRTGSYAVKTGTSMAAPMVAGIALLHLEDDPNLTQQAVRTRLITQATTNAFAQSEMRHDRIDAPRYIGSGQSITSAEVSNPHVDSPNRLAYAWFTKTDITWEDQSFVFEADEQTRIVGEIKAFSSDYYRDRERVNFSYESLSVPTEYSAPGTIVFYKTLNYIENRGNIVVQEDVANFRINAPMVTGDTTGTYMVVADDGRTSSARRFSLVVRNVPQPPVWISPPAGNLTATPAHKGDLFDDTTVLFRAVQSDNLPITYTITPQNALPPGLQFVNDTAGNRGYLRGRISNVPYSEEPKYYEFLIRATASNGMIAERLFVLTCEYRNELHYFAPSWLSSLYDHGIDFPGVKEFGSAGAGNSYFKRVEVINKDADPLVYAVDFVPSVAEAPGVYNGALPTGLGLTQNGDIQGIVDPSAPLGMYFFRITVEDLDDNVIFQDFVLELNTSEDVLQDSDQIIWITPAGNIGSVYETFASHLYVEARNPEGTPVRYSLSPAGGILPDGMEIHPDTGLIIGIAPFVENTIDYTFIVRATVGSRFVDREFSFTIISQYSGVSVLNFKANVLGYDRLELFQWTDAREIIPKDEIFRETDPNFGTLEQPFMYVLSGTSVVQPNQIMDYLKDYHKRMYLVIGNLAWAPAYDPRGEYVYDTLYMSVFDPLIKTGGFLNDLSEETLTTKQSKPYDPLLWDESSQRSRFYPNSVDNARDDLISTVGDRKGLGMVGEEGLPLWMRAKKQKGRPDIVGFTPGIVLAYVKPGKGQNAVNLLAQAGFNRTFRGREFILDRYFISDVITKVTTVFDVVGDEPTTIFDDPNLPNAQGDDLSHLVQQTLFDVKTIETGKYYKFEDDAPILADRLQNPYR